MNPPPRTTGEFYFGTSGEFPIGIDTGALGARGAALRSTKNAKGERDPEMHKTKKGNQWYHGMEAHIGVGAETGLAHSLATTAANVSDVATAHELLHGGEESVHGDAGYQGVGHFGDNRKHLPRRQWVAVGRKCARRLPAT